MAYKLLPAAAVIFVAYCQALDHRSFPLWGAPDPFFRDTPTQNSDCADLPGSISLNFSGVGLRRLGADFTGSPNVSCLSFDDNEIDRVSPRSFRLVPNLFYLSLARNRLDFADLARLEGHLNLRTLVLDGNRDVNLTDDARPVLKFEEKFHRLFYLYARDCGLRDVAPLQEFAPSLMHLHLAANDLGAASSLEFLEEAPPPHLRSLDLADNGLTRLDAGKLEHLRELRLDGNRLDGVCAKLNSCDSGSVLALAGMKRLARLSLARNSIAKIEPAAFEDFPGELAYLDLSDNRIQSIEVGVFEKMSKLRNFSLKGNELAEVPDIRALKEVQHLSLAGNKLEVLKNRSFSENRYLESLDLSNNSIANVEHEAFAGQYHSLEVLDLSYNKLTELRLPRLTKLRVLHLNDNLLTSLNSLNLMYFKHSANLKEVYLQNNRITKINSYTFAYKSISNIVFVLFDAANNSTVQSKNAEKCKCDCGSKSDFDISNLNW